MKKIILLLLLLIIPVVSGEMIYTVNQTFSNGQFYPFTTNHTIDTFGMNDNSSYMISSGITVYHVFNWEEFNNSNIINYSYSYFLNNNNTRIQSYGDATKLYLYEFNNNGYIQDRNTASPFPNVVKYCVNSWCNFSLIINRTNINDITAFLYHNNIKYNHDFVLSGYYDNNHIYNYTNTRFYNVNGYTGILYIDNMKISYYKNDTLNELINYKKSDYVFCSPQGYNCNNISCNLSSSCEFSNDENNDTYVRGQGGTNIFKTWNITINTSNTKYIKIGYNVLPNENNKTMCTKLLIYNNTIGSYDTLFYIRTNKSISDYYTIPFYNEYISLNNQLKTRYVLNSINSSYCNNLQIDTESRLIEADLILTSYNNTNISPNTPPNITGYSPVLNASYNSTSPINISFNINYTDLEGDSSILWSDNTTDKNTTVYFNETGYKIISVNLSDDEYYDFLEWNISFTLITIPITNTTITNINLSLNNDTQIFLKNTIIGFILLIAGLILYFIAIERTFNNNSEPNKLINGLYSIIGLIFLLIGGIQSIILILPVILSVIIIIINSINVIIED